MHISAAMFMCIEAPSRQAVASTETPRSAKMLTNEDIVRDLPDRRNLKWVNAPNG